MEVSGQRHAPVTLPQGRSLRYPLNRRLGGSQSRSGHGVKKNSQPLPGLEPAIIQTVARCCNTKLTKVKVNLSLCLTKDHAMET
jgi:hypothetical protein